MASRLFYGSKPSREKKHLEGLSERPSALPKPSSSIPAPTKPSKIPAQQPSSLPRSKGRTADKSTSKPHTLATKSTLIGHESASGASSKTQFHRTAAPVPTGIPVGMGTRTEISSNPPPPRNRLRRKASTADARGKYARSEVSDGSRSTPSKTAPSQDASHARAADPYPRTVLGISMPEPASSALATRNEITPTEFATSSSRMASYALQQPQKIFTTDLSPPIANFGVAPSSSSSTRYSESPGPFSRTSTPTSASSYSPGLLQAPKFTPRARPSASPIASRPPVTRRKLGGTPQYDLTTEEQGLSALRESQTSSSSSSTAKGPEPNERSESSQSVGKVGRDRPAPTPPLRISSKRGKSPQLPSHSNLPREEAISAASSVSSRIARPLQSQEASRSVHTQTKLSSLRPDRPNVPPPRPSREGIPTLEGLNSSPVVRSNMSRLVTTGHKRRESIDQVIASSSKGDLPAASRSGLRRPSSVPSSPLDEPAKKTVSPSPSTVSSPHLHARRISRGADASASRAETQSKLPNREPSPRNVSPSKSPSRFGLFSRRVKSPSETSAQSPPSKLVKKGPAAGTGHEGYGRHARRGRSTSTSTAASRNRSTSTDRTSYSVIRPASSRKSSFGSNDSKPDLDDFFKERLEPVVIGGGGMIRENRNSQCGLYQTTSGQSSVGSFASGGSSVYNGRALGSSAGPSSTASSQRASRELLPAPHIVSRVQRAVYGGKTLAHRRSLHRSQLLGEAEVLKIPPPINTRALASSPLETYDSTISSAPRTDASLILTDDMSEGHEGNWLKPKTKTKTAEKGKQSRRWNFFQRTHRSPERPSTEQKEYRENGSAEELQVAVSAVSENRPVAHYTMLDEPDEMEPEQDLEDILRDIEGHLELDHDPDSSLRVPSGAREHSMLLPSPPKFPARFEDMNAPPSPKVLLYQYHNAHTQAIAQAQAVARAQASAQIRAPEQAKSSVRKPSRLQQVGRIPRVVSRRDRLHNPSPKSFSRPFAHRPSLDESPYESLSAIERPVLGLQTHLLPSGASNSQGKPASAPSGNGALFNLEREFLSFPHRKYSETSGSSSSGTLSLAPITAITPGADTILDEDEVWNEYDDLLEHVDPTSSELQDMLDSFPSLSSVYGPARGIKLEVQSTDGKELWDNEEVLLSPTARPMLLPRPDRLAIPPVQQVLASPTSFSELYSNYANRASAAKSNPRHSTASITSGSRYSSQTMVSRSGSRSSVDSSHAKRVTQVMAEKTHSASTDSLRFSALMTSRWLSFDRVLFSPAQDDICGTRQSRVLVLDGLDNDDWATYCALTYPDAAIYNLASPREKHASVETADAEGWVTPPNLRRISHASVASPFPFPKGFFSAVVFRFPAINTSIAYRNAIFECKRVLRPGGYLELCMLDMDMVNMGDRARRAVRGVKVRMQEASPDVNLSPISDTVMKLLGRRGFENINRCVVGVPVAGSVSKSRAGSMDDDASGSERTEASKTLADLLAGQNSSNSHYTGARMVAKVARWWWTRCYEREVLDDNAESVWNNKDLLRECEERETGLRLVVCYAQKPESIRRRTVSV